MIGQLILTPGGRGRVEAGRLYGLPVLRGRLDPAGLWGKRRLCRAGRGLLRGGARRVLAPEELLPLLAELGLRPVNPECFIRAQAVPLALAALERQGIAPGRAAVALRGQRVDRDMLRAAEGLCPLVRRLIVDAPRGGAELACRLRREYGTAVLPPGERGEAALIFQKGSTAEETVSLELFGPRPRLAGLIPSAPGLEPPDQRDLSLLAALWEGGKLSPEDIKIT